MKKLLSLFAAFALVLTLSACTEKEVEQEVIDPEVDPVVVSDMNIVALKGPTAMGMVSLMADESIEDVNYNFEIIADTSAIPAMLAKGEVDIAAVPANLASVIYNNTDGAIEVLAINTLGVLYIVESADTINSVDDLKGKTIYATGKGATPEYSLNYILSENGLDIENDVKIEWKAEAAEVLSSITNDPDAVALLPEPFVTTALKTNTDLRVALDLTDEWNTIEEGKENPSALITGVVVARKAYVEENPEAVKLFLEDYKESVDYINANLEEGAKLVGEFGIVPEAIALIAIPNCNLTYIDSTEMKEALSGYLTVLYNQNPASVGGELPLDDFYYEK